MAKKPMKPLDYDFLGNAERLMNPLRMGSDTKKSTKIKQK